MQPYDDSNEILSCEIKTKNPMKKCFEHGTRLAFYFCFLIPSLSLSHARSLTNVTYEIFFILSSLFCHQSQVL